jgi:DHA1 family multidrug resistance protein-like MFS transporter
MKELVRDTIVGHLLRLATKRRVLHYEEERDQSLWKRYLDKEKSGRMAHHGSPEEEEREETGDASDNSTQEQQRAGVAEGNTTATTRNSSDTQVGSGDAQRNEVSGVPVDPEKGRDVSIVTWFGDDDPEVCISPDRPSG